MSAADSGHELADMFIVPEGDEHPAIIAERLLDLPEHAHLRDNEARIEFVFRTFPQIKQGRQILGTCNLPTVTGSLRDFFTWLCVRMFGDVPDFLIILDYAYWQESSAREREILVYHELFHAVQAVDKYGEPRFDQDGRPVWAIRGHDVEEFTQVVARYGQWNDDIRRFVAAANEGGYA